MCDNGHPRCAFRNRMAGRPIGVLVGAVLVTTLGLPRAATAQADTYVGGFGGMSRALLKLSGGSVHDYATISADSPSPNRASRARRAATSAGIS